MTTPSIDLPDWTVQALPDVANISVFNQGFSVNNPLIGNTTPFRIWGAWISAVLATDGTFVAAGLNTAPRLVLADSSLLLAVELNVTNTKDKNNMYGAITLNGFTAPMAGGSARVNLVTDAGATGAFLHVSCGVFFSIP